MNMKNEAKMLESVLFNLNVSLLLQFSISVGCI